MVPLTREAVEVLAKVRRVKGSPWVFPGRPPDKPMTRLHDLLATGARARLE